MIVMKIWVLVLAGALALSGCSALGLGSAGSNGRGGRPAVVASFYPLAYVAQRIGGHQVTVTNLTAPGREPHDLELTVKQTAAVGDADVVIYERGLQAAVDDAVDQTVPADVVDAAQVSPPAGDNPHIWLDPLRMAVIARAFERRIADVDPVHAASYQRRLADLTRQLRALDRAYRRGLAHCAITTAVVSHDAFGYLQRYGIDFAYINGLSPDAEPSPAHLRRLQDLVRSDGITTVFSETLASPELVDSLAHDLGIRTAVLDPIEGLSEATADQDYLSLMRANLRALENAQECR